ncbi:MAG: hypothetical protein LJE70_07615 [Chromatiaceae bacterium]|nr:hypothetical protein [Chromatiaceae bacterium]
MNLDEWLAILAETRNYPTLEDRDLGQLTGTGSEYDLSDQREDAAERSDTRSDGLGRARHQGNACAAPSTTRR